jgi:hypothetical protein
MNVVGQYSAELQQHLHEKGVTSCPACGSGQGGTCPGLNVLHEVATGPGMAPFPATAVVPLVCFDCGYVMMFFAAQVGIQHPAI